MATLNSNVNRGERLSVIVLLVVAACETTGSAEIWRQRAPMPTARLGLATAVVDGKIYAIGGYAGAGSPRLPTVEVYDPATDTWTTGTPMPTARAGLSANVVDGKIYVIGGSAAPGVVGAAGVATEEYDPLADKWTTKTDMPTVRGFHSASVVDGKIYVMGGSSTSAWSDLPQGVDVYDPSTDAWTKGADIPTVRNFLSTAAVNGKVYAIGGALSSQTFVSAVEEYDPLTDTWAPRAAMPTSRGILCTAVVDGQVYAIGGGTTATGFAAVETYDPTANTWTKMGDMPAPRAFVPPSAAVVNGKIYIVGGSLSGAGGHPGVNTVYEYDPAFLFVDFNGDGKVDGQDILIMAAHWGEDYPYCDIAPAPLGDGIVDVQDLIVLAKYVGTRVDDPTLLAHWAFDEAEGVIAHDSVGAHDGIMTGIPGWQRTGAVDGALEFNGTTCVTTDFVLNPGDGPLSVFAWIKGGAAGQIILSQQTGANWLLLNPAAGALMTELKNGGRSSSTLSSETIVADGDWHRIGFTWDGANRGLYVHDILVAADTQAGLAPCYGGLLIGCDNNMASASFWTGLIDDVRIYNRAVMP